jgi:2-polyprenyl-6-methoxyphenol hydroxylase-like FAD-dependent oxidoreductase
VTDSPVIIVGGGPVGLTLALELAWHGIRSTVFEPRMTVDHARPRAKTVNVRSMEHFRRLGLAAGIRSRAPLDAAWNQRALVCTSLTGHLLASFDGIFATGSAPDERFSEGAQQITQPLLEEILRDALLANPLTTLVLGSRVTAVRETDDQVTVEYLDSEGGSGEATAEFVVGADGAGGITRASAGIGMDRGIDLPMNLNVTFRSTELDERSALPTALHYWVVNATTHGVLIRLDRDGTWAALISNVPNPADADPVEVLARLTGFVPAAEILSVDPWQARMALADSYGTERVFLAGDAAHLNPPWGGHGFNAGLGDAVNLGWKLAAVLDGWAGAELLASYEAERRPIAQQTIAVAVANMRAIPVEVTDALRVDPDLHGPDADEIRAAVHTAKHGEFNSLGLVLGYHYGGSPLVAEGGHPESDLDPRVYEPRLAPGARLPHRWMPDGRSIYDLIEPGFTLFADPAGSLAAAFLTAASERGIPLAVAEADDRPATLVRSDGHVAWFDSGESHSAADILDLARGVARVAEPALPSITIREHA